MSKRHVTRRSGSGSQVKVSPSSAQPRHTGLSRMAEMRLRDKARRRAPSSPWVDAQFKSFVDVDHRGRPIVCRYHDPSVFPPGGAAGTAMVRCPACGIFTPPFAFEQDVCLDHAEPPEPLAPHLGWGRSPSAVAIEALQYRNLRLLDSQLPSESVAELREEIRKARGKGSSV